MVGRSLAPYRRLPYFFSDQYDVGMEYTGLASPDDELVVRGEPDEGRFVAFWLRDGRISAAMNVNVWDVADTLGRLILAGRPVDRARLADPDVPLGDLAGDGAARPGAA